MALGLRLAMNLLARTFGLGAAPAVNNGYLLENGVDFYLLEDGSGVYLLE